MIGIRVKSKKELKEKYVGKDIGHLIVETSLFGIEFQPDGQTTFVGPCPYTNRKFYGQVVCNNSVLLKVK